MSVYYAEGKNREKESDMKTRESKELWYSEILGPERIFHLR